MPSTTTTKSGTINKEVLKNFVKKVNQNEANSVADEPLEVEAPMQARVFELPKEDGWVTYTSLFKKSFTGQEHAVRQFKKEDWPENLRIHIPEIDDAYVFPKKATEQFVVALMQGDKTFIQGPKGSGKSSLPQQICARLNIPFVRVNCREDMESSAIFGSIDVQAGSMVWHPGPAEELGLAGGLLQVDEIAAAPAGINLAMQWMLEEQGKIYLADKPGDSDDKLVTPHPWFRIVATDNTQLQGDTTGHYGGTQVQNEAMLDRFQTTIKLDYLERSHETTIIKKKCPGITNTHIKNMLEFASLIRTAYNEGEIQFTMSPRTLINWGRKVVYWNDPIMALEIAFFDKLVDDDRKIVNELCHKVFGKQVN